MMKRGRGRPRRIDPSRKKISIDQAVQLTREYWAKFGKPGYSKGYIYNLISKGELHRDGPPNRALLFEDEVLERLCG